jgi:hypothetical protein
MEMVESPSGGRDAQGRWLPGQSGNAAGKRPGTRNRATLLREFLRDGEEGEAVRAIIEKAKAGHWAAARFVIEGIAPKPRGRLIELDLPEDAALPDAIDRVVQLMACGEISMEEAQLTIRVLREQSAAAATPTRAATAAPQPAEPASSLHLQAAAPGRAPPDRTPPDRTPPGRTPARLGAALRSSTSLTPPLAASGARQVA